MMDVNFSRRVVGKRSRSERQVIRQTETFPNDGGFVSLFPDENRRRRADAESPAAESPLAFPAEMKKKSVASALIRSPGV